MSESDRHFPPGTTGAIVDELRGAVEAYRADAALPGMAPIPPGVQRMAALLERAADHVEDLADQLTAAEHRIESLLSPGTGEDYGIPDNQLVDRLRVWSKSDDCTLSALVERAAEVLDSAERDIARLNDQVLVYEANFETLVFWAHSALTMSRNSLRLPVPHPTNREETTPQ